MALKTDYKDFELVTPAEGRRVKLTNIEGDVYKIEDVSNYKEGGNTFGAQDINDTNARVEECFRSVSDGKALLASAITDKGVTTAQDATFAIMAENIARIAGVSVTDSIKISETAGATQGSTATASLELDANQKYIIISFANGGVGSGYQGSSYAGANWFLSAVRTNVTEGTITNYTDSGQIASNTQCLCSFRIDEVVTNETVATFTASAEATGDYKPGTQVTIIAICAN